MGVAGWFLLLIIGAASTLIPMFLISHQMNEKKLKYAFYLINSGLLLLTSDWFFLHGTMLLPLWGLVIVAGVLFFISYVRESYKKRLRKKLDVGMKHTMVAIVSLIIPVVLGVIYADPAPSYNDLVLGQAADITAQRGKGDINALLRSGRTWEVK